MASKKSSGMFSKRTILPGSEKAALVHPAAEDVTPPRLTPVTVSVIVKRKTPLKASHRSGKERLTHAQYRKEHAADPAAVKLVKAFAKEFDLKIDPDTPGPERRTILLTGTVDQMQKAFGTTLSHKKVDGVTYRVREGSIEIPTALSGSVVAVLGLDNRPQAKPHFRIAGEAGAATADAVQQEGFARPHASGSVSYTPIQVAELYQFPAKASAAGQTIGIIELGGGYKKADITAYFKSLGVKAPKVTAVLVDKAKNKPTNANSADGEVLLDIEVAGAVAPGANIVVYFTPNTDQGFVDAISTAVHDTKNKPSVISISWGAPEVQWTAQSMNALDAACQSAAALGITITVASGDNGSTDGVTDGANHVDFPASSPHVLGCGGTNLQGSGSTINSETVWNALPSGGASGGGVSNFFPLPSWQSGAGVPKPTVAAGGRGVPDVAGDADPATGYEVRVDGANYVFGGTSAVAPLWAGLIALANAQNGTSAGFLQTALYSAKGKAAFRDITQGDNPAFQAGTGWDGCTGLGSPIAPQIISLIKPATTSGKKVATKVAKKSTKKIVAVKK
ncbi:S53 family peptidase [Granulicella sibirica]|uniref:Kumamolysin n=1 Tax=Granulicella sibirica TaxID=2479048 RepID=A0A4Q0T5D2_9BACT|nr:S53 family peptidase [Granulicella sibirica]RXH58607.1 Kumamolysin [Granulicella sibirica]